MEKPLVNERVTTELFQKPPKLLVYLYSDEVINGWMSAASVSNLCTRKISICNQWWLII